jgi:hypothetical protein
MFKRLFPVIVAAVLAAACAQQPVEIPYAVAEHYFFRNDAEIPTNARIDDLATFDTYFGSAAVMGIGGRPTHIDFRQQFVIAVVNPITDIVTELVPVSLVEDKKTLVFTYQENLGEQTSYSMQPMLLIIVNRSAVSDPSIPVTVVKAQ